jgi:hypothetical protein
MSVQEETVNPKSKYPKVMKWLHTNKSPTRAIKTTKFEERSCVASFIDFALSEKANKPNYALFLIRE